MQSHSTEAPIKPSRLRAFNYAIGMFGTSLPVNLLKTYAAFFYVTKMGLTTTQWASVMAVYTFIDAVDNPFWGFLSDSTRTRWGRRKPWLVLVTPILIACLILFFSPTSLPNKQLFIYAMVFFFLTGTLDALINSNYGALFPELFRDDDSRAKANAMRQAFQLVAMIIAIALTPIITEKLGYSRTAMLYGIVGGIVILYMALTSRETPPGPREAKPNFFKSLRDLAKNPHFWLAGFTNAFYAAAMASVMAALTFYAKYALMLSSAQTSMLFGIVLLVAIVSVAVWAQWVSKHPLMRVWRLALVSLALAFIPLFFAQNLIAALLCAALVGFGFAGCITTMDLIGARVMDEDAALHHVRREGIIAQFTGFLTNLFGSLAGALGFFLMNRLFGFINGENPGPNPGLASRFMLCAIPFFMMLCAIVLSGFLHFEQDAPASPAAKHSRELGL
ncbi:MAG: MFS transporter [Anaerolineaceae bacterium]|nr:MFS transporter [Anaerolineaceae bacterium]